MKILFTIPTLFHNKNYTIDCINSLKESIPNTFQYDIYVVSNIITPEYEDWKPTKNVHKDCSKLKFNIAKAINLGIIKRTDHEYFCFVDEGIRFKKGWIDEFINIYNQYKDIGVIGTRPHSTFNYFHIKLADNLFQVLWTDGIMFMKYDRIDKIGLYDESYFCDCETQDFCYRLIEYGNYKNLFLNSSKIFHKTVPWEQKSNDTETLRQLAKKSQELFGIKWEKWRQQKYIF